MLNTAIDTESRIGNEPSGQSKARLNLSLQLAVLFLLILSTHLIYHFTSQRPNAFFAPDGPHYLTSCRNLTQFLLGLVHGKPDWPFFLSHEFAEPLALDGPVVPGIPALVFTVLGHAPKATGWHILVGIYSFMAAAAACLVSCVANRLTGNPAATLAAGLIFGLLPTTMVATGRFCSEVPAALLILIFALTLSRVQEKASLSVPAGLTGGLLAICKPLFLPTVALSIAWTVFKSSRKLLVSALLVSFVACSIVPWAVYTKVTLGKASITADRVPSYNAAAGTDRETDGWSMLPQSNWSYMMSSGDSAAAIILSQWSTHPSEMFTLTLRRYSRMFAQPWNSFRADVFGITPEWQRDIYLFLLAFGKLGLGLYFLCGRSKLKPDRRLLGDVCVIVLISHFSYLVVQAISRYAFTILPVLSVFAVYGFWFVTTEIKQGQLHKPSFALASIFAALFVGSVLGADYVTRLNEPKEIAYHLSSGDSLKKEIVLPATSYAFAPNQALVLIDGDQNAGTADVTVNGHELREKVRPLAGYYSEMYRNYPTITEHTEFMGISVDAVRQWRAAPVPISWLNLQGKNDITIAIQKPTTVYADSDPHCRLMLLPNSFAHDQLLNNTSTLEPRVRSAVLTGRAQQTSFATIAGGSERKLPGTLRINLALLYSPAVTTSSSPVATEVENRVSPEAFNDMLKDKDGVKINRYLVKFAPYTGANVKLPPLPQSTHLQVDVTGIYRTERPGGCLSIPVSIATNKGQELTLGRCPHYLKGTTQWQRFSIEDLIPRPVLDGYPTNVSIYLFPYHWQQAWLGYGDEACESQVRDLKVTVRALDLPDMSKAQVYYF